MVKLSLLLLGLLGSVLLQAQTPNFDVEQRTTDGKPAGWFPIGTDYDFVLDSTTKHSGRYALRVGYRNVAGFSGATWRIPARFGGKKVTLTAFVKTRDTGLDPNTFAGLWMRIDDASGNRVAFDNMQKRGIKGTTDWQQYTITLPLSDEAESIYLGGLLVGKGTVWFDDFDLKVDGKPVEQAPLKVVRLARAQTDTVFSKGSGIALTALTASQIDNLVVLGKVWGFIKYHHPAVAEGNHNMETELFRVMPAVLKATSSVQRDGTLLAWVDTFGPVKTTSTGERNTAKAAHQPDLDWLADATLLSAALRTRLATIREARRSSQSYYIGMSKGVGNPEFKHENPYRQMTTPDAGYRLLALYRFWNIIQYFFPYKHLIGEDWNKVLPEFIPAFVNARDSLSYRLGALSLIGRVHDTHANVWGDPIIKNQYKGLYYAPIKVKHIENQFVVTNYYNDSLGKLSGLRRGDVVKTIDGVSVSTLVGQRRMYYPASNDPTQLRDISRDLLRGHSNTVTLEIDRDGQPMTSQLTRYLNEDIPNYKFAYDGSSYPKDSCYQLLHPDVGYLFLGNIKADKLPRIMERFKRTKGLIIDLRCYPADFVVLSLGKYLMLPTPFAKFTQGSVQTP
ncbi:MAG: peptidase S41, partial [Bacteroidetes bacterium]|nr:peptidase S41 [Fibrella sp.]